MEKTHNNRELFIRFLALKEPWLYLSLICYFIANIIVIWLGNPLLPLAILAKYGWAWHHIPEILGLLFLGMYLGSFGWLSPKKLNYFDLIPLSLLTVVTIGYSIIISYISIFEIVAVIVLIPSFGGYFGIRWVNIQKTKKLTHKQKKSSFS